MKIHEVMADNRIRFAQRLNEMSEELANLAKEVDKNRKSVRPSPHPHPFPSLPTPFSHPTDPSHIPRTRTSYRRKSSPPATSAVSKNPNS